MNLTTHSARITGPVAFQAGDGQTQHIPLGPCLLERGGDRLIDIIWGEHGQHCEALPVEVIAAAHAQGHLVLLD